MQQFVDKNTWTVNQEELLRAISSDSSNDAVELKRRIKYLPKADSWYVARGHDMVAILRIGLLHILGDIPISVGVKKLGEVLQEAMTPDDLQETKLWTSMRTWEAANHPYMVLATESPE